MTALWLAGALPRICASLQHTECLLVSHNNITLFGTMIKELQKLGGGQLEAYLAAGRDAGCPVEQMRNFAVAGVVLQPRQLAASAAARLCDQADGPTAVDYGGARGGGKSHWLLAQMGADDC